MWANKRPMAAGFKINNIAGQWDEHIHRTEDIVRINYIHCARREGVENEKHVNSDRRVARLGDEQ